MTVFNAVDIIAYKLRDMRLHDMDATMLTESIRYEIGDDEDVHCAISLAALAHHGQTRPGSRGSSEPYITHPLRNTLRLIRFSCRDTDVLAATTLHDTVEDQPERLVELMDGDRNVPSWEEAPRQLNTYFNPFVSNLVRAVTNPPRQAGLTGDEKNAAYAEHVTAVIDHPQGFLVKVSDFIDNAGSLSALADDVKRNRLRDKYTPLVPIFQKAALHHGTALELHPDGFARLTNRLDKLAEAMRDDTALDEGSHFE